MGVAQEGEAANLLPSRELPIDRKVTQKWKTAQLVLPSRSLGILT